MRYPACNRRRRLGVLLKRAFNRFPKVPRPAQTSFNRRQQLPARRFLYFDYLNEAAEHRSMLVTLAERGRLMFDKRFEVLLQGACMLRKRFGALESARRI